MIIRSGLTLLLSLTHCFAMADCVEGAMSKTKFSRLNNHTVALTGWYGSPIVIKTSCRIKRSSQIAILKDSFCSSSEAVLSVDGIECDAENVSEGDKFNEENAFDEDNWDYKID